MPFRHLRVGIICFTIQENVADPRNSKVVDIYRQLASFGVEPQVHDPLADPAAVIGEYGVSISSLDEFQDLDALVLAVPHSTYRPFDAEKIGRMIRRGGCLVDVKSVLDPGALRPDIAYWSL